MIRILEIANAEAESYVERWARFGINAIRVHYDQAPQVIQGPACAELTFDAVVIRGRMNAGTYSEGEPTPGTVYQLGWNIRLSAPNVAMFDGKKWCAIPVICLMTGEPDHRNFGQDDPDGFVDAGNENNYGADVIRRRVKEYREAVLADLEKMGFVVRHERGRYTIAPAFQARQELESHYYFGQADRRTSSLITVHRDNFGIQVEVDEFEWLINRPDVSEAEIQKFFESHPYFLTIDHTPLPQVHLPKHDGTTLIPDFILKPIVAQQRDSRWEVLDLKLPQVKLLSGRGSRATLSAKVMGALRQLRDYKEYFEHPQHAREVETLLGLALKRPKLGVLIGKLANTDFEILEREQHYHADVRIVTYDEILEQQQALLAT